MASVTGGMRTVSESNACNSHQCCIDQALDDSSPDRNSHDAGFDQDQQEGLAPGLFGDSVNEAAGCKEDQAAENNGRELHSNLHNDLFKTILLDAVIFYLVIPINVKLSNFKNLLFLSILKRFHTHSCYYIVPSKSKATNLIITFFIYLSNNSTWISNCNTIRRNIFCNNTPCTYYSTISN